MTDTMNLDRSYIAGTYNRFPVEIVSGKGCIVKDADGKAYIDLTSGIGVTSFGVADEIWQQAVIAHGAHPVQQFRFIHGAAPGSVPRRRRRRSLPSAPHGCPAPRCGRPPPRRCGRRFGRWTGGGQ